ncbi:MAG: nucleotidyltransferase domain-containing protein [Deltaproteobacteria bacterium]|nr:nucleotidyltransferase domain-containing protein [Deltaproteobacteria bacterium]
MRFGLKESVLDQITAVFAASGLVDAAILYGSRAKNCHRPGSDIDITLKGEALTLKELNRIALALDDLLLPYTFDLSAYRHIANPELLAHIQRVGKVLYRKSV